MRKDHKKGRTNMALVGVCWNCNAALDCEDYRRQSVCRVCSKDTRVCYGCSFYDEALSSGCRETQADWVMNKASSNFCDYFKPNPSVNPLVLKYRNQMTKEQAWQAAEALFKKKP